MAFKVKKRSIKGTKKLPFMEAFHAHTYFLPQMVVLLRETSSLLWKVFDPLHTNSAKKVVLLLLYSKSSRKFVTPAEEIRVLKKGYKKTKLFYILFSLKTRFLARFLDQKV